MNKDSFIKTIALLLTLALAGQEMGMAALSGPVNLSALAPFNLKFPQSVAVVEEVYRPAQGDRRTLYLVQDAPTH